MSLDPLLSAPTVVQIHVAAALLALGLGPLALYRRSRDRLHKALGRGWVALMGVTAASGFPIPASVLPIFGTFGPIHALSAYLLWGLAQGIWYIRRGQIAAHAATMRALYWQANGLAALFTLMPGRRINAVVFGEAPDLGWWVIGGVLSLGLVLMLRRRGQRRPSGFFT